MRISTLFSIVFFFSGITAVVAFVLWIVSALRKKKTASGKVGIAAMCIALACGVGITLTYTPQPNLTTEPDTSEPPSASQQQEAPSPAVTPQDEPEASDKGKDTTEHTPAPVEPSQATENPLLTVEVQTRPVMNGTQTERIGTWAFIQTTKETAKAATPEQFQRYMTGLDAEDYNWFNIFFEDGTGLYIAPGMGGYYVEYGQVDQEEGGAVKPEGNIIFSFENNHYVQVGGFIDTEAVDAALMERIPQEYQDEKWFYVHAEEYDRNGEEVSVDIQIDQGGDDFQAAKNLAAECYGYAREIVDAQGVKLVSFSIAVVNKGAPVAFISTSDGKTYSSLENGKITEFTLP